MGPMALSRSLVTMRHWTKRNQLIHRLDQETRHQPSARPEEIAMREGCSGTPADDALAPPLGASQWERTLFDHLTTHIVQERELLEEYVRAAAHTESKALAYLINWLIDDERRHHDLFMQLALSLKASAELQADSPEVPRMDFDENTVEVRGHYATSLAPGGARLVRVEGAPPRPARRQGHHAVGFTCRAHATGHGQAHRNPAVCP